MKHLYLAALLMAVPLILPAQETDLEKEIRNYSESRSELISKGRRLLLDTFLEEDYEKVKEIKKYLLEELQNDDYVALYPGEEWMIMYRTGEYRNLLEAILQFDEDALRSFQRKILPGQDILYAKLLEKSWTDFEILKYGITKSDLSPEAKDFLLLHLNFMLSGEPLMTLTQEQINVMADQFLETHPGSSYEDYVRNNIRYRFVPSKWGFAFEFFSGYGISTGELSEMYNNHGVLGVAFDVEYRKFTLYLRNYIGFAKTKQDQEEAGVVWPKGARAEIYFPEASIGYAVLENEKIKISPFAGMGGAGINPSTADLEKRPELEELEVGFAPAYTVGVNMNIKLKWDTTLLSLREDKSYWFVRLRYGYTMPQFGDYPRHDGNVHQLTIGLGGMYRGMRREL